MSTTTNMHYHSCARECKGTEVIIIHEDGTMIATGKLDVDDTFILVKCGDETPIAIAECEVTAFRFGDPVIITVNWGKDRPC